MSCEFSSQSPTEANEGTAEPCAKLLDRAASAAAIAGIQRGLQSMYAGTGESADVVFAALEDELGVPEKEV